MDWDDLRYIRALAATGTLAGAAGALGVNHSTVFRRLGRIERNLGVRLFERHREGLALTAAGEEAAASAERLGIEVDELERRLAGRDQRPGGTVRLTTTDTLLTGVLGPVLAGFRRRYPAIRLEVTTGNPFLSLTRRDADIALRPTADPPETLVGRKIAEIATAVYGSPHYLEGAPALDLLAEHDWLAPDESLAHLRSSRWLRRELPSVQPVQRCNSLVGLVALAEGGAGLAPLPCFFG
ncbi:LysR substrate-binding domain-containing protein [Marinobacter sp. X15-166B]|uniref:LysR substrate-binding domain-containing protein n=1 Tax=Marinobacter sp. X15-166B TaxID=1897620 RepID=UPI0009F397ED|nr:LysR substrate-binding domain-containing protein [Marinobacter sp. X15-166B]